MPGDDLPRVERKRTKRLEKIEEMKSFSGPINGQASMQKKDSSDAGL
jgi:hypothetical protein